MENSRWYTVDIICWMTVKITQLLLPLDMSMDIADMDKVIQHVLLSQTWCLILGFVSVLCSP